MSEIIKAALVVIIIVLLYKIYSMWSLHEPFYPYIIKPPRYCRKLSKELSKYVNDHPIPQSGIFRQADSDQVVMNSNCPV